MKSTAPWERDQRRPRIVRLVMDSRGCRNRNCRFADPSRRSRVIPFPLRLVLSLLVSCVSLVSGACTVSQSLPSSTRSGRTLPPPALSAVATDRRARWLEPPLEPTNHGRRWVDALRASDVQIDATEQRRVLFEMHLVAPERPGDATAHAVRLGFLFDETHGVQGSFLIAPDTRWLSLDGRGGIFQVAQSGKVFFAATIEDGIAARWQSRTALEGITEWSAAGDIVVAAGNDTAFLSRDGGLTYTPSIPKAGAAVTTLIARTDGVVVARTEGSWGLPVEGAVLWISPDGGRRWERSSLQTRARLERAGDTIVTSPSFGSSCTEAALSIDGKSWSPLVDTIPTSYEWKKPFFLYEDARTYGSSPFALVRFPETPAVPRFPLVAVPRCPPTPRQRYKAPRVQMGAVRLSSGRGAECLLRDRIEQRPAPRRSNALLFSTGACANARAQTPTSQPWRFPELPVCAPDDPLVRPASALFVDEKTETGRAGPLPLGCRPRRVRSAGGLHVVLCDEAFPNVTLHVATSDGRWIREGAFAMPRSAMNDLLMAADSTLLFHSGERAIASTAMGEATFFSTPRPSRAWVRRPVPVGARNAWRELSYPDAVAFTVLPRGEVLVVTSDLNEFPDRGSIVRDRPEAVDAVVTHAPWPFFGLVHVTREENELVAYGVAPERDTGPSRKHLLRSVVHLGRFANPVEMPDDAAASLAVCASPSYALRGWCERR